jgi:hypothetical protein
MKLVMQLGQQIVGEGILRYLEVCRLGAPWIWFHPRYWITEASSCCNVHMAIRHF